MSNLDFKRRSIAPPHSKKIHNAYYKMLNRCYKPTDSRYKTYGGRGIKVCDRWLGKDGFINFINDMGEPSKELSLDRVDNNQDYSPENCQWIPRHLQMRNRTITRWLHGENMTELCRKVGIQRTSVYQHVKNHGVSFEEAFRVICERSGVKYHG